MNAVDVTSVAKTYGPITVLDHVSIDFEAGKFTSLLGPSGSGKTTLLRIIAGFVTADVGRIRIRGEDVTTMPVWKRDIGIVFQSYALFPHMSVAENVAFGLYRRGIRGAEAKKQAARALEMVRLTGFDDRLPKQLSGGQQQRVALARAIVTRPKVLLLDEPLSALDRRLRQEMQVELLRIQRESGLTTIFVTHDQEEALTLSDRIAILDKGRIVQEDVPSAIYERPRTRFAAGFLGDANFLAGTVAQGAVRVGDVMVRTTAALPGEATSVTLAVRPERISIGATVMRGDADNSTEAVVREVIYAGATTTYLLEGPAGVPFRVFAQNRDSTSFASGAAVRLHWSAADTICLED
jgi:putative spermidine/putrescine transport system ATP-binding protein/spermidine/putrescine transport system ATP-binding protein